MKKTDDKYTNTDENASFAGLFSDVKPLQQDKIIPPKPHKVKKVLAPSLADKEKKQAAAFAFSDGYQAYFNPDEPLFWHRGDKAESSQIKHLRKGHFPPDIECDLHGLTLADAQGEIADLLFIAKRENCLCVKILHGHGTGRLKQAIPNWLVQHPDIVGFCQAPKGDGGSAAILVLMDIPEELIRR